MALDARSRSSIYQKLVPHLGEDDANALMSEFPSVEADELVTKQFLRAQLAELRSELRTEIGGLRTELHTEIGGLRTELHTEIGGLRAEMVEGFRRQTTMLGAGLAATIAVLGSLEAML